MRQCVQGVQLSISLCVLVLVGCIETDRPKIAMNHHATVAERLAAIRAMANPGCECSTEDQASLLALLEDPDPAVRVAAIDVLPCRTLTPDEAVPMYEKLIKLLDDPRCGDYCSARGDTHIRGHTPSVRAQALLKLTEMTNRDFGFNQSSWSDYVHSRAHSRAARQSQASE